MNPFKKGVIATLAAMLSVILLTAAGTLSQNGNRTTIRSTAVVTNIYQSTTAIDLQNYDSVVTVITVPTANAGDFALIKSQWSDDQSTWVDEPVLNSGNASGTETVFTPTSRVVQLAMTNTASAFIDRSRRLARYFRYQVKSTNVTTATMQITATPMSNQN